MENISIPPFYIGQEVVANCDDPNGDFKKGDDFLVKNIRKGCCGYEVDIGINMRFIGLWCDRCGMIRPNENLAWCAAWRFSPKLEIKDFISMKQLAEQQLELIAGN